MRKMICNLVTLIGVTFLVGCVSQPKPEDSGVDLGIPTTSQQLERLGRFGNAILNNQEIMEEILSSVEITILVPTDANLSQNQITTDMIKDHIALTIVDRAGKYAALSGKSWDVSGNINNLVINGAKVIFCRDTITNTNLKYDRQSPVCSTEKPLLF